MKAYYKKDKFIFEIEYNEKIEKITLVDKEKSGKKSFVSDFAFEEISAFLDGNLKKFSFEINPQGTDFQKKVWREIEKIPYGKTITYKEIGEKYILRPTKLLALLVGKIRFY